MYTEKTESYTIHIGRNAEENDRLVRAASPESVWFHIANHPSPHGILSGDVTPESIQRTANLVKQYSKFKSFASIRVNAIECKHVAPTEKKGEVVLSKKPQTILAY
jgi:predicted ribosome quality control (RQC) complex YloA/Tae2 family protein